MRMSLTNRSLWATRVIYPILVSLAEYLYPSYKKNHPHKANRPDSLRIMPIKQATTNVLNDAHQNASSSLYLS